VLVFSNSFIFNKTELCAADNKHTREREDNTREIREASYLKYIPFWLLSY
jgi:hypothetical protein